MNPKANTEGLFEMMVVKAGLKQQVYRNTINALNLIKDGISDLEKHYAAYVAKNMPDNLMPFESSSVGEFEIDLKFGGDILMFLMHTNVFEFSRNHEVMHTDYIREDKSRSYCGIINIYNFIADSFKYNRVNDVGYLIGRIFINKDNHYFVEGKRELGFVYNDFGKNVLDAAAVTNLLETAITYTTNFDLLTPNYDMVKEVTVYEMKNTMDTISLKTGKRLGFKFQSDVGFPDE
jgi:hypothetical protein